MKIAVVGCGAVGSFYGAKLCRAGHDVHFLLRSDYEVVRSEGVRILTPEGDFAVRPHCARRPEEIGPAELVLIGLKTTANDQFPKLLPPLAGSSTRLITLQNGLGNEEAMARLFPPCHILGGLCFVCLNRIQPGVIRHTEYGTIVIGEYEGGPVQGTCDLVSVLQQADVPCKLTDDLARAHWEKLVWNIPFNGLGVAGVAGQEMWRMADDKWRMGEHNEQMAEFKCGECLGTDRLLADVRWESLVRELMLEVIRAANALGFPVPESLAERQINRTRTMGAYKASTLIDFEAGRPLELESLFVEPLRRATAAGVPMPRLKRLCEVLQWLDSAREGV